MKGFARACFTGSLPCKICCGARNDDPQGVFFTLPSCIEQVRRWDKLTALDFLLAALSKLCSCYREQPHRGRTFAFAISSANSCS